MVEVLLSAGSWAAIILFVGVLISAWVKSRRE